MPKRWVWLILTVLLCATASFPFRVALADASADHPPGFWLLTSTTSTTGMSLKPEPPLLRLGDEVWIKLSAPFNASTTELWLDGMPLKVAPQPGPDDHVLIFPLVRNDANRGLWAALLGLPFAHCRIREVSIAVSSDGKPLKALNSAPPTIDTQACPSADRKDSSGKAHLDAPSANIELVTFGITGMSLGLVAVALVVLATVYMGMSTTLLRDRILPQLLSQDRPYSLGRFQMTVWFCVILAAFVFILVVTNDPNSITTESFTLLGISAGTALGSIAIDMNKNEKITQLRTLLTSLGLKSCEDVVRLRDAKDGLLAGINPDDPALPLFPAAVLPGMPNLTIGQFWEAYASSIKEIKSSGFVADLVNDIDGPTIHRWQILIWTLVLAVIYLVKVYGNLEVPTLGTNLLTLMGISSGVYLGFKIPEKQQP